MSKEIILYDDYDNYDQVRNFDKLLKYKLLYNKIGTHQSRIKIIKEEDCFKYVKTVRRFSKGFYFREVNFAGFTYYYDSKKIEVWKNNNIKSFLFSSDLYYLGLKEKKNFPERHLSIFVTKTLVEKVIQKKITTCEKFVEEGCKISLKLKLGFNDIDKILSSHNSNFQINFIKCFKNPLVGLSNLEYVNNLSNEIVEYLQKNKFESMEEFLEVYTKLNKIWYRYERKHRLPF